MEENSVNKIQFVIYLMRAIFIVAVAGCLLIILCIPSRSPLGEAFTIGIIYMLCRGFCLWWVVGMLALRLVFYTQIIRTFLYVLCAVLNCIIGLLAIYLFMFHHYTREWLHLCLFNLLLGAIMLADGAWTLVLKGK